VWELASHLAQQDNMGWYQAIYNVCMLACTWDEGMYPTDKSTETRYFLMLSQNGTKLNFGTIRRLSYVTSQSIVQEFDHIDKAKVTDASEQYEVDVNDQPIYVCC
jgi:hypothetical protein